MNTATQTVKDFITKNYFSYLFLAFVLIGLYPLLMWSKVDANVLVNDYIASYTLDPVFILYSQVFEGWCFLGIAVAMLFISRKKLVMFVLAGILCWLITLVLKDYVFGNLPRPNKFLPLESFSHILEDVSIYKSQYTFPSGHSMTAFAVMSLFSAFSKRQIWPVLFFVIAIGAAFSRIYLLQHFFVDIYAGAIIGYGITILNLYLFTKPFPISDTPLISLKKDK